MYLIRNAEVYSPEPMGKKDLLITGNTITAIGDCGSFDGLRGILPVEPVDAAGLLAVPGIMDQHVHVLGGGGEDGFRSIIPALTAREIFSCGVTTVVGLMGTNAGTKNVENLLTYTKQLNADGVTAYCLTGSYAYPSPTITGSVGRDILLFDEMLGVKLAISDHRCYFPTEQEILQLAAQVRNSALISGKVGEVHMHLGKAPEGLKTIIHIVENTVFPIFHFRPTHVANNLEDAVHFAALGGMIDFTSGSGATEKGKVIGDVLAEVPAEQITVSSDANGSMPRWDAHNNLIGMGVGTEKSLLEVLKHLVTEEKLDLSTALSFFTSNVAKALKLPRKGRLVAGKDADILLLDPDFTVKGLFTRGKQVVDRNGVCYKGYFD